MLDELPVVDVLAAHGAPAAVPVLPDAALAADAIVRPDGTPVADAALAPPDVLPVAVADEVVAQDEPRIVHATAVSDALP